MNKSAFEASGKVLNKDVSPYTRIKTKEGKILMNHIANNLKGKVGKQKTPVNSAQKIPVFEFQMSKFKKL
jgi:hypothetical protein